MTNRSWMCGLLAAGIVMSCNPVADDSRSAVFLTLQIEGEASTEGGKEDETTVVTSQSGLFSDVVGDSGQPADDSLAFRITSIPKNPNVVLSEFYTVQLTGYRVDYFRTDGRNEPGVDVPFPLTLPISATISPGNAATIDLLVVTREQKLERPLRDLWFGDGRRIFLSAQLTLFGQDLVQNAVSTQSSALVAFSDFPG